MMITSETSMKNVIKEKIGELISVDIGKINISEFNTRCQFVDTIHVKFLMKSIEQHGYIPKSAVWINAVTDNGKKEGNIIQFRLVAGRHRHEAATRLGFTKIPCQLYYNLTDEEECELDTIDNELDDSHKPVNFFEIAEHYKYLRDIKGWSIRKIAKSKNISKGIVQYRLQIADLPEEVLEPFGGVHKCVHFRESYFRDICKLNSIPHQILICREIINSNLDENKKTMTQSDIKIRVEELLELEKEHKISQEVISIENNSSALNNESRNIKTLNPFNDPEQKTEQLMFEAFLEISKERINSKPKETRFSVLPMWLKHTNIVKDMKGSAYLLLQELVSYDFRYKPEKDSFFFITPGKRYENSMDFIAHIAGVNRKTLEKKVLPALQGFVFYKKNNGDIKFQLQWDSLFKFYKKEAVHIPFNDGGLEDIPSSYTGWIRPTPYHSIYIEDGVINKHQEPKTTEKVIKKPDIAIDQNKSTEKTAEPFGAGDPGRHLDKNISPISDELKKLNMGKDQVKFCIQRKELTEDVLKYYNELPPMEKNKINNPAGYIYTLIKDGFKAPENFKSSKEVKEKKEKKQAVEEFGEKIQKAFYEGKIKYFSPEEGLKYSISLIPDNVNFLYYKIKSKVPVGGCFCDWMDLKYFSL